MYFWVLESMTTARDAKAAPTRTRYMVPSEPIQ
jgi:hypothetical protein